MSAGNWWLRSPNVTNATVFRLVITTGGIVNSDAGGARCVAFGFWQIITRSAQKDIKVMCYNIGAGNWWLRSPNVTNATNFRLINTGGNINNNNAGNAFGVAFGFGAR